MIATESEQRSCTEYLEGGNNGSISSPGFPDNYPNNVNYTRIINVKNTRSRVNFTVLYLEAETDGNLSCFDYLKVSLLTFLSESYFTNTDGYKAFMPLIEKIDLSRTVFIRYIETITIVKRVCHYYQFKEVILKVYKNSFTSN